MGDLFELWVYLSERPLLWLTVTVLAYWLAHRVYHASNEFPLLNPFPIAVTLLVSVLVVTGTSYETYFDGAQFVHFLLGPATVALALPLYNQAHRLRRMWLSLGIALLAGSVTAVISAFSIGWLLGLSPGILLSLLPKSVTTPVAMGVAEQVGGLPSLTAVLVILTGLTGAVAGVPLLRALGQRDPAAKGFAIGVAAHGLATARAFEHSEEAGAFAGLGMGLNAALTALLVPFVVWLAGM